MRNICQEHILSEIYSEDIPHVNYFLFSDLPPQRSRLGPNYPLVKIYPAEADTFLPKFFPVKLLQ